MEKLTDKIKSYDSFGTPISVNYKGSDSYQTIPGGIITLIARIFLLYVATTKFIQLYSRSDPNFTPYTVQTDLSKEPKLNWKDNKFNFSMSLFSFAVAGPIEIPPEFGYIQGY